MGDAEARYALRAGLRALTPSRRERQCGVVACHGEGPWLEAVGRSGAWRTRLRGLVTCGHIWTCPVCSHTIRSKRCDRAVRAVRNAGGRWQLLTLTIRHHAGMGLPELLDGMSKAWRRARQGSWMQRLWGERVSASIRSVEVTHGKNGWHPHIHVALRTSEWSSDVERNARYLEPKRRRPTHSERDELARRWRNAVRAYLGEECVPDDEHGVRWSEPLDASQAPPEVVARYVVKLAWELTDAGVGKSTPWHVAADAVRGDPRAVQLWAEYHRASRGRRMIELDDRAAAFARQVTADHVEPPEEEVRAVPIDSLDLQALRGFERSHDRRVMARLLADAAAASDPARAVDSWVSIAQGVLRAAWRRGRSPVPLAHGPPT